MRLWWTGLARSLAHQPMVWAQDGQIFVVKIMHGANLTEKAREEVRLSANSFHTTASLSNTPGPSLRRSRTLPRSGCTGPTRAFAQARNEVRVLASLNHPNIVKYYETFVDGSSGKLQIVMEYCEVRLASACGASLSCVPTGCALECPVGSGARCGAAEGGEISQVSMRSAVR